MTTTHLTPGPLHLLGSPPSLQSLPHCARLTVRPSRGLGPLKEEEPRALRHASLFHRNPDRLHRPWSSIRGGPGRPTPGWRRTLPWKPHPLPGRTPSRTPEPVPLRLCLPTETRVASWVLCPTRPVGVHPADRTTVSHRVRDRRVGRSSAPHSLDSR